jgi:hypothetical protein
MVLYPGAYQQAGAATDISVCCWGEREKPVVESVTETKEYS